MEKEFMKSATQQKQSARKFVEYWTFRRGSEKGEDQQFWNSLLGEVLGLEDVKSHVQYQVPVPMKPFRLEPQEIGEMTPFYRWRD